MAASSASSTADNTYSQAASASTGRQASQSSGLVGKVKERATEQLSAQKDRATDGLGAIVHAVRQTGERLRGDQQDTMARYVEQAASQLERLSTGLREKDVNELLQDAQRLARRQPALFIGGSFAVGLLAARFLKSSQAHDADAYSSEWNVPESDSYSDAGTRRTY